MGNLTREQVESILKPLGFKETEDCANFVWFEYPSRGSGYRAPPDKIIARIQFYIPGSEMDAWCYRPGSSSEIGSRYIFPVFYEANVANMAAAILRHRLTLIALDAADKMKWSTELNALIVEANRDPGASRVLHSWLLDHGVDPF